MSEQGEEGGTVINRGNRKPPQQMDPRMAQQMDPRMTQQMDPRMAQQMDPRMAQQMDPQMVQQQQIVQQQLKRANKPMFSKLNMPNFKQALLVALIFILLNSKMIWKQIIKIPFMGSVEPSIVALIVNSILAGIVFYLVNNYMN